MPLATAILSAVPAAAFAQQQADTGVLEEVLVTAQKRSESLQDVPISITAIGTEKLEELHVTNFEDYAKLIPSLSFQTLGPGFVQVYMRGVANGGDGNHSGSLPSVGVYLDEQPVTTIQGSLDIHVYDIERVEALAGPQGTLYGASSQAGTVRIITNKPDPSGFKAGYDLTGTTVSGGDQGYTGEGFVNIPLGGNMAVRMVGWYDHNPGYIDNVVNTRTFPTSGICITNSPSPVPGCEQTPAQAKSNYNDSDIYGGRAALRINLGDTWSITPQVMGQRAKVNGFFAYDTAQGNEKLSHYYKESSDDKWGQAALTVEGKLGNFDMVYAGAFLKRDVFANSDYTDYSFFYDTCCGYGSYWYDNSDELINPSQFIVGKDRYQKWSNELRFSSPQDWRFHFIAGLFIQRQQHAIEQRYMINDLADLSEVTGWPDTWWLTEQVRVDRDKAAFGEFTFDFSDRVSATYGLRYFKADNSLEGFYGFGLNQQFASTGEKRCFSATQINGGPCMDLDKETKDSGHTDKVNLTFKVDDRHMYYLTYSEGFRPGGINRQGDLPPYKADFLKNYEVGWKTTTESGRARFNGALFIEDWDNFQFSFLGANSLTQIANAGNARVQGVEVEWQFAQTNHLTWGGGFAFMQAELTANYCGLLDANANPVTTDPCPYPTGDPPPDDIAPGPPLAPRGTQLPVTPKFKGNLTGRYEFPLGGFDAHAQASFAYVASRWPDLRVNLEDGSPGQREILGKEGGYLLADFTFGIQRDSYAFELFVNNAFDKNATLDSFAQCDAAICGLANKYVLPTPPRTIGLQFSQKF
ncbi:MAG TPA: TonB-dependent receptor [Steroidobacteraceae bacterium]|nr:TonB-dependent receptor [Steroidobacteraceae bacterium]